MENIINLEAMFNIEGHIKSRCFFSYEDSRMKVSRAGRYLCDLCRKKKIVDFFKCIFFIALFIEFFQMPSKNVSMFLGLNFLGCSVKCLN